MKSRLTVFVAVLCLSVAGLMLAHAQGRSKTIIAEIKFPFTAGEKSLPAGSYRVELMNTLSPVLTVRAEAGGESFRLPIITRLAPVDHVAHETQANLVFDSVGDQRFLSEVWLPGQDGFLVRGTSEEHEHAVIKVKP